MNIVCQKNFNGRPLPKWESTAVFLSDHNQLTRYILEVYHKLGHSLVSHEYRLKNIKKLKKKRGSQNVHAKENVGESLHQQKVNNCKRCKFTRQNIPAQWLNEI